MGDYQSKLPMGLHMRRPEDRGIVGTLRDLEATVESLGIPGALVDLAKTSGLNVLQTLADIYQSSGGASPEPGNLTDLTSDRLPPIRGPGIDRPQPTTGGGFKNGWIKLKDVKLLPDFQTLSLSGEATATYEIGTEYPASFDTPTDIDLKISSAAISPTKIGFTARASYKMFHADLTLQLHYDDRKLIEAILRLAKQRNLSRSEAEALLRSMSFDASAVVKAGLPVSWIWLSASSMEPMRRPLIGSNNELAPSQFTSLPDRKVLILGAQAVPAGVFFDTIVPAGGLHYSKYGRSQGVSLTIAGLAKPNLDKIGEVQTYGYLDLHYAKRVSNILDIDIGITYTRSQSKLPELSDPLQLQYLHAQSKSWLAPSRDNAPEGADRSGQNFMFTIKGEFEGP